MYSDNRANDSYFSESDARTYSSNGVVCQLSETIHISIDLRQNFDMALVTGI